MNQFEGLTLIPELYYLDLSQEKQTQVKNFSKPIPVREISIVYHRPYAKLKLIEIIANDIKEIMSPLLETTQIKNKDLMIAKM